MPNNPETAEVYVICGERLSRCECVQPQEHWPETPHACDEGCGGSWTYDADGEVVVVSFPSGLGTGRVTSTATESGIPPFMDPILAMLISNGPIRVQRGGIKYVIPPALTQRHEGKEGE